MAFQLGLGCTGGYNPEHRICGCCKITSSFEDACSSLVTWQTTGNSPTIQIGSGASFPVAKSGSQVFASRGPFTLRTSNGPSCVAPATNSCCGRATRVRVVLNGEQLITCNNFWEGGQPNCNIPGLPPRATSSSTSTSTGPVGTIDLEFPLSAQCSTNIPVGYTVELGTFTTTISSSGSCEIYPRGSRTETWSGSNFTSAKLRIVFGFPPPPPPPGLTTCGPSFLPQWFFQYYDKVNIITGTHPNSIFPYGDCTGPGESALDGIPGVCEHPPSGLFIKGSGIGLVDDVFTSCIDIATASKTVTCVPC